MNWWDKLKMALAEAGLPLLVGVGEEALHEELIKMQKKSPEKFRRFITSWYVNFKGTLQPFVHTTKTKLDDTPVDATVTMLEEVFTELGIPLPVVEIIDFSTP